MAVVIRLRPLLVYNVEMLEVRSARDRLDHFLSMVRRTLRYSWVAFLTVVVGGGLSVAFAMARPRVYKSETLILYREGIRAELGGDTGGDPAQRLGMKLKELVLSRTSLQETIAKFHLYPELVSDRGYVDAVDEMRRHIAFRTRDGDTFGLSFEGADPTRVRDVTAQLATALIDENSRARVEQANVTKEFLDTEKRHNEQELKVKETALAQFLAKHPEFARENPNSALHQRAPQPAPLPTGKADATLMALERQAERIRQRLAPAGEPRETAPAGDPRLIAARDQAESEAQAAQRDLQEKLSQFTEQHPDVRAAQSRAKALQAKLQRAEDAVAASAARMRSTAEAPVDRRALEADLQKISAELIAYRGKQRKVGGDAEPAPTSDASLIVGLETEWSRLSREVAEARERQKQVEEKQFRAVMAANSLTRGQGAQMSIVDPAYLPTHPSRQSRTVVVGAGLIVSFGLGLLLSIGCALLDDHIYDRLDLERLELLKLLVVVPPGRAWKRGQRG